MKRISLTLLTILFVHSLYAQSIVGDWYGALNTNGATLRVVFHISKSADTYVTNLDSPDQGANGIGTDKTTVTGNHITIEAAKYAIKYSATFIPDSNIIKGTFVQGAGSSSLILTHNIPTRPQDPTQYPYKQEEVTFTNPKAGNTLAGTLTLPSASKVSKIVVLITGSGPQDRNEEIKLFNHRPFLVWSDWLTRNGIAVLRYDDRGINKSTGVFATATTADFADDTEAAVNFILSREDLKKLSIGLMGHSEGGIIAPIVASRNKAVKFICLLAGPGIPTGELMLQQQKDQLRLIGASAEDIKLKLISNQKAYQAMNDYAGLGLAELKVKLDTVLYRDIKNFSSGLLYGMSIDDMVKLSSSQLLAPWFRYFISVKPADYLSKVKCPVLALNGTLDSQVESTANLAGIKSALQKSGNQHHQEIAMPELNHFFQKAKTGALSEYSQISETVDPQVLEKVSAWINQLK